VFRPGEMEKRRWEGQNFQQRKLSAWWRRRRNLYHRLFTTHEGMLSTFTLLFRLSISYLAEVPATVLLFTVMQQPLTPTVFTASDARIFRVQKMVPGILNKTEHRHIYFQNSMNISIQFFLTHISGVRNQLHGAKFPRPYSLNFSLLRFVKEAI
jgi:hypothetical protein